MKLIFRRWDFLLIRFDFTVFYEIEYNNIYFILLDKRLPQVIVADNLLLKDF